MPSIPSANSYFECTLIKESELGSVYNKGAVSCSVGQAKGSALSFRVGSHVDAELLVCLDFARLDQRPADDAAEEKPLFFDVTIVLVVSAAVVAALVPMQLDFLPVISLAGIALESVVAQGQLPCVIQGVHSLSSLDRSLHSAG